MYLISLISETLRVGNINPVSDFLLSGPTAATEKKKSCINLLTKHGYLWKAAGIILNLFEN